MVCINTVHRITFCVLVCSCLCGCVTKLEAEWITMARGTMPARPSCASRISVSTSCVAARLTGYSTCQAIQRLPSGTGKLSIFRSTWSTLWNAISDLPKYREKKCQRSVKKRKKKRKGEYSYLIWFILLSVLMTTNSKGWCMCLWLQSMTFYPLRFFKMSSPPSLVKPLLLEWYSLLFLSSVYMSLQVMCTVNRTSNLVSVPSRHSLKECSTCRHRRRSVDSQTWPCLP